MKNILQKPLLALSVILVALSATATHAADFDKGLKAALRGDFQTALREWRPLARQGHTDAQFNLAMMYVNGDGVPKSPKEAARWFREAATRGHGGGQRALGQAYEHGLGVPRDPVAAYVWYDMSARIGDIQAPKDKRKLARKMNASDRTRAMQLADTCHSSKYRDCP